MPKHHTGDQQNLLSSFCGVGQHAGREGAPGSEMVLDVVDAAFIGGRGGGGPLNLLS